MSFNIFLLSLFSTCFCHHEFIIPEAKLEFLSPKGLQISIPATDPEVSLVAFHINLNEDFYGVEHGHWAEDILKTRNGRWLYEIKDLKVKPGDNIYYWVYAIKNGIGYQNLNRSFQVSGNPHHQDSSTLPPVDWKSGNQELNNDSIQ